jgi:hypothetical protein
MIHANAPLNNQIINLCGLNLVNTVKAVFDDG